MNEPEAKEKIAVLLGEGFFADKIVSLKDRLEKPDLIRVKEFVLSVQTARKMLNSDKLGTLDNLHSLTRFHTWFSLRHGQQKVKNKQEAEDVFRTVLDNLVLDLDTRLDFYGWLQQMTLTEVSELINV